ncbi:MAG: hypothetical protein ACO3JL_12935 [Myxococcota bacterium]
MATVLEDLLLRSKLLDEARVQAARAHAAQHGLTLVQAIITLRLASDRAVAQLIAGAQKLRVLDPTRLHVEPEALQALPSSVAHRLRALPLRLRNAPEGAFLHVAMSDPTDGGALAELSALTQRQVVAAVAEEGALSMALQRLYPVDALEPALAVGVFEVPVHDAAPASAPHPAYLQASPPAEDGGFLSESTGETVGMYARLQAGAAAAPPAWGLSAAPFPQSDRAPLGTDSVAPHSNPPGPVAPPVDDPFAALEFTPAQPIPSAAAASPFLDDPFATLDLVPSAPFSPAAAPREESPDPFAALDITRDDGQLPGFMSPDDPNAGLAAWEPLGAPDAFVDDSYDDTQDSVSLELELAVETAAPPGPPYAPREQDIPSMQAWGDSFFRELEPGADGPSLTLTEEPALPSSPPPPVPRAPQQSARGYLRAPTCVVVADPALRRALRTSLEGQVADLTAVGSVDELRALCALLPLRYGVVIAPNPDEAGRAALSQMASLARGPDLVLVDADAALAISVPSRAQLHTTANDDVAGRILDALWELEAA